MADLRPDRGRRGRAGPGGDPAPDDGRERGDGSDPDRGQLFVVGALALATVFLLLAVLLNSAIYAGSVATRDDGTHAGPAVEYDRAATAAAAGAVREVARDPTVPSGGAAAALDARLTRWRALADHHVPLDSAVGSVTVEATTPGTYAAQPDGSRSFVAADGAGDWALVTGASVRAYETTVRPVGTVDGATAADGGALRAAAFRARFENASGSAWNVAVYRTETDPDRVCVRTFRPNGTAGESCADGPAAAVSFTGGTVNGTAAPALGFLSAEGAYDVSYHNGDAARGTFGFVAEGTDSVAAGNFVDAAAAGPNPASPFRSAAVYGATVGVDYRGQNVRYETSRRIAPDEAGGTDGAGEPE